MSQVSRGTHTLPHKIKMHQSLIRASDAFRLSDYLLKLRAVVHCQH